LVCHGNELILFCNVYYFTAFYFGLCMFLCLFLQFFGALVILIDNNNELLCIAFSLGVPAAGRDLFGDLQL